MNKFRQVVFLKNRCIEMIENKDNYTFAQKRTAIKYIEMAKLWLFRNNFTEAHYLIIQKGHI